MTIEITQPELERLIAQRLGEGTFQDAQEVILQALRQCAAEVEADRRAAVERLKSFSKRNDLGLDSALVREMRDQARP